MLSSLAIAAASNAMLSGLAATSELVCWSPEEFLSFLSFLSSLKWDIVPVTCNNPLPV